MQLKVRRAIDDEGLGFDGDGPKPEPINEITDWLIAKGYTVEQFQHDSGVANRSVLFHLYDLLCRVL
jgi:hypothetical protein